MNVGADKRVLVAGLKRVANRRAAAMRCSLFWLNLIQGIFGESRDHDKSFLLLDYLSGVL